MRLLEITSPTTVTVYHGSGDGQLRLSHEPIYGVEDFGFAASYAIHRAAPPRPVVYTLEFHMTRVAGSDAIHAVMKRLDLDIADSSAAVLGYPGVLDELKRHGFDGLHAHDFGFRHDFEEIPVWAVFDAVRQARIVARVDVEQSDISHRFPRELR